ncbi:hypothetical protein [Aeromicrobium ginsengisoli]|uniref:Uncharacterized protein n=1 Tax=Aeromicrobium ginsengisoli TaxID=363867 RepID=A0A5M4FHK4_9ACTN|nr:hypothetical protein [Aeromicrobium ginsengisoli]KAA1399666.1 hypothetical protein ESP70_002580 [Aeromicrobium ginsengisoli]
MTAEALREFDDTTLPNGSRGWTSFVDWLCAQTDSAESDWLELKSEIDPHAPTGLGKIVKFILGAANRDPEVAGRHLSGHALLVLGIQQGHRAGVPSVEDHILEQRMHKFLGHEGPGWDTVRLPGQDGKELLILIVNPPKQGDRPYPCRADGVGVATGDIYVRAKSQTRKATAADHDMLYRRGLPVSSPTELPSISVELTSPLSTYTHDEGAVDSAVSGFESALLYDLPSEVVARKEAAERHRVQVKNLRNSGGSLAGLELFKGQDTFGLFGLADTRAQLAALRPIAFPEIPTVRSMSAIAAKAQAFSHIEEDRSEDQFRSQVSDYIETLREALADCPDLVVRQVATKFEVLVSNTSDEPLEDLTVVLHIEGPIETLTHLSAGRARREEDMPLAPRTWGPRPRPKFDVTSFSNYRGVQPFTPAAPHVPGPNSATARTTGSVTLTLELASLRSREKVPIHGDEILIVRDSYVRTLHGTWEARARNLKGVLSGKITLAVSDPVDITDDLVGALEASRQEGILVVPSKDTA